MAVLKPRTAIVIVLTISAAAVFSLILLPRWQSTKANSPQQSDQSNVDPRPLAESLSAKVDKLDADKEAIWSPQGQPEATKSVLSTPINPQKPVSKRIGLPHSESFDSQKPKPGKPKEAERDDGQRLLRKLKEISMESQPQRPEAELDKTPNTLKYERLRSLLGRMHEPHMKGLDDLSRDDKPKLSKILEKEALEELLKKHDNEEGERFETDKGKEREIPLRLDTDNKQEKERQLMFGMNKGHEGQRQQKFEGKTDTNLNRNMGPGSPRSDNSVNTAMGDPSPYRHKEPTKATTLILTTTIATTSPPLTTVSSTPPPPPPPPTPNSVKDLPSMKRGSVEIRPERLPPPAHSSDIYYSLLTAPVFHNLRFSLQYLTWLQTVDPKQVSLAPQWTGPCMPH